jgi:hypothetical protein
LVRQKDSPRRRDGRGLAYDSRDETPVGDSNRPSRCFFGIVSTNVENGVAPQRHRNQLRDCPLQSLQAMQIIRLMGFSRPASRSDAGSGRGLARVPRNCIAKAGTRLRGLGFAGMGSSATIWLRLISSSLAMSVVTPVARLCRLERPRVEHLCLAHSQPCLIMFKGLARGGQSGPASPLCRVRAARRCGVLMAR